jgi:hypothetical protein
MGQSGRAIFQLLYWSAAMITLIATWVIDPDGRVIKLVAPVLVSVKR